MSRTDRSATEGALESFLASSERFSGKYRSNQHQHHDEFMRGYGADYATGTHRSQNSNSKYDDEAVNASASFSHYTQTPTQSMLSALRTGNGIRHGAYGDSRTGSKPFSPYVEERSAAASTDGDNDDERSRNVPAPPYSVQMSNEEGFSDSVQSRSRNLRRKGADRTEYRRTNTDVFRDATSAPSRSARNDAGKGTDSKCSHCSAHAQALDYAWKCYLEEQEGKFEAMQRAIIVEEEGARRALQVEAIFRARILYAIFMETCANETLRIGRRSATPAESRGSEAPMDTRTLLDKWHALVSLPSPLKSNRNHSQSAEKRRLSAVKPSGKSGKQAKILSRGISSSNRRLMTTAGQRQDNDPSSAGERRGILSSDAESIATASTGGTTTTARRTRPSSSSSAVATAPAPTAASSSSWYKKVLHPRRLPPPQHEAGELLTESKPSKLKEGNPASKPLRPNLRSMSSQTHTNVEKTHGDAPVKNSVTETAAHEPQQNEARAAHHQHAIDSATLKSVAVDKDEMERLRLENAKLKRDQEITQQLVEEDKMEWNELYKNMTDVISNLTRERNSLAQSITHDSTLLSARSQPNNWESGATMLRREQDSIERQLHFGTVQSSHRGVAAGGTTTGGGGAANPSHLKWTPIKEMDNAIAGLGTPFTRNTDYGSEVAMSPDELTFSHISVSPPSNRRPLEIDGSPVAAAPQQIRAYGGVGGVPPATRSRDQQQEGSIPVRESTVAPPDPHWSRSHLLYQPLQRNEPRDPRTLLGIGKTAGDATTAKSAPKSGGSPLKDVIDDDEFGSYRRRVLPY